MEQRKPRACWGKTKDKSGATNQCTFASRTKQQAVLCWSTPRPGLTGSAGAAGRPASQRSSSGTNHAHVDSAGLPPPGMPYCTWLIAPSVQTATARTPLLVANCKNERRSDWVQPVSVIVPFG